MVHGQNFVSLDSPTESMEDDHKSALEEIELTDTIEEKHLSLCSDSVKLFYSKVIVFQNTINENTKSLREHSQNIFNLEESTLNQILVAYLRVTIQAVKNCDFRLFSSNEKVGFQNLIEELVGNIRLMSQSMSNYRETFMEDRRQLRKYIAKIANLDTTFAHRLSEQEWELQQEISLTISKLKQRGPVKNSLRFLTANESQSPTTNPTVEESPEHNTDNTELSMEVKLNDLLISTSVFLDADSTKGNVKRLKELPNYFNECLMKIMNFSISYLSDMCKYVNDKLESMFNSINLHSGIKDMRSSMKPNKRFLTLQEFEKYIVFTALRHSELTSTEHWLVFLQFEKLLEDLIIIFEMLKKLVIQNGMIERKSKIIGEKKIAHYELDWLSILSTFGIEQFNEIILKIQEIYDKAISNEISDIENDSSSSGSIESRASSELSTIDIIFSRFIMKEEVYKPLGINIDKVFISKLKLFEELIAGKLSKILRNLNHPKVSQAQNSDTHFPVGFVSIISFLISITSLKIKLSPDLKPEIKYELKREYNSALRTINEFGQSSRKYQENFTKKLESFVKHSNIYKKYRSYAPTQFEDVMNYLGEPSITNVLARIWFSDNVPHLNDQVFRNPIDITWDSGGQNKITCQGSNFENLDLETQIKLVTTFLKTIQEAFRKAELNFTRFRKNISTCQKEINGSIWQKRIARTYETSYNNIFAIHTLFLKHAISESSLCIQMLRSIAKDAKFFILYGYTNLFGKWKKDRLSDINLSPVKCENFTVHLKQFTSSNSEVAMVAVSTVPLLSSLSVTNFPTTTDNETRNSTMILSEETANEFQYPLANDDTQKDVQEEILKTFEPENNNSLVSAERYSRISFLPGLGPISVSVNRIEDLLISSLTQILGLIQLPNTALKDNNGLLEKEHVDFIDGLVTLINCAALELHLFTKMTWEMIRPLQIEYDKACHHYRKSFAGSKSHSQVIKLNIDKIQAKLYDLTISEISRGKDSLENFLDKVISSTEHGDSSEDIPLNQETLFKFIHNFDLANTFAKQSSCSVSSARWAMDDMGLILKNELTHENRSFRNLSLEVQLLVLKSLITFYAYVLNSIKQSMRHLKDNSKRAKDYFKGYFIKLVKRVLHSRSDQNSEIDTRQFRLLLQKLKQILSQSKSKVEEISVISSNAMKSMEEAMNYIRIRFSLESTLIEPKSKHARLADYRPVYTAKMRNFEDNLISKHRCTVGANVPLKLVMLPRYVN